MRQIPKWMAFPIAIVLLAHGPLMAAEPVGNDAGYPRTFADAAYPATGGITIVRVPDYLYANAAYDVPITFEFRGLGDNVFIQKLSVVFIADGRRLDFAAPPFARDDGIGPQNNGLDLRYTAWLPTEDLRKIKLPEDRPISDTCYFVVHATAVRVDANGQATDDPQDLSSPPPDPGVEDASRPRAFGDQRIAVVDIGNPVQLHLRDDQQKAFRTSQPANLGMFLTYHPILAAQHQVPQTEAQLGFHKFNISSDTHGAPAHTYDRTNELFAFARIDSRGALSDLGHVAKVEFNQFGVGVYWAVSYPALTEVQVLERREGMNLDRAVGSFSIAYGNGAPEIVYIRGSSSIGDLYRSTLTDVLTLAQAAAIIFPQFKVLQWVIRTGGTLRTIASAVDVIQGAIDDAARPEDAASATITHLLLLKRNTGGGSVETQLIRRADFRTNGFYRTTVSENSTSYLMTVGDTFQYHVDIEVAAQVNKRIWFSDYASAQAGYHHSGLLITINSSN